MNYETNCGDFKLISYTAQDVQLCLFNNPVGDIPFLTVDMENEGYIFKASVEVKKLFLKNNVFYYLF